MHFSCKARDCIWIRSQTLQQQQVKVKQAFDRSAVVVCVAAAQTCSYFFPGVPCLLKYLLALVGAVRNFPRARGIVRYLMYVDRDLRATTVRTRGTKYAATVSGCTVMKHISTASM